MFLTDSIFFVELTELLDKTFDLTSESLLFGGSVEFITKVLFYCTEETTVALLTTVGLATTYAFVITDELLERFEAFFLSINAFCWAVLAFNCAVLAFSFAIFYWTSDWCAFSFSVAESTLRGTFWVTCTIDYVALILAIEITGIGSTFLIETLSYTTESLLVFNGAC